jgi:TatD DNase family protein
MLVDSHCHLDFAELNSKLDEKLANAKNFDVSYLQTISTKISEFDKIREIADKYPQIFCSVGIHPNNVSKDETTSKEELVKLAEHKKVIGIGETGLDYYYKTSEPKLQIKSFETHIRASQDNKLPVIIHSRDAEKDTIDILSNHMKDTEFPALIHCFTASKDFAKKALDLGLYISLSGIVTFKNAEEIREAVKLIPLDRILIETDSPYLAPVPKRGKSNEPAYVKYVAEYLAEFLNIPYEKFAKQTTDNFFKLFSKAKNNA